MQGQLDVLHPAALAAVQLRDPLIVDIVVHRMHFAQSTWSALFCGACSGTLRPTSESIREHTALQAYLTIQSRIWCNCECFKATAAGLPSRSNHTVQSLNSKACCSETAYARRVFAAAQLHGLCIKSRRSRPGSAGCDLDQWDHHHPNPAPPRDRSRQGLAMHKQENAAPQDHQSSTASAISNSA